MSSWSDMFLEYFQTHRKMLIFTVILASLGMMHLGGIVFSEIIGIVHCLQLIENNANIAMGFGICNLLDWLL